MISVTWLNASHSNTFTVTLIVSNQKPSTCKFNKIADCQPSNQVRRRQKLCFLQNHFFLFQFVKKSTRKEYVFDWMCHSTYVISLSPQAKLYVHIWFKYLVPITCLKKRTISQTTKTLIRLRQVRGMITCLARWVIQPMLFHYSHKPNDTCSFELNILFH